MEQTKTRTDETTDDERTLKRYKLSVEKIGSHGWMLLDHRDRAMSIGDHGLIAPRRVDAVKEGLARIKRGDV